MAEIVNDRDVLIMSGVPRYTAPANRDMFLSPPSAIFKVAADGLSASPSSFAFQATLLNLAGTVTFTATAGLTLVVSGNTATLTFANFTAANGAITASITVDGVTYTKISTVTKLADGAAGTPGTPGLNSPPQTAAQLKDTLLGQITKDQFVTGLQSTIGLIDGPATLAGSVAARLKTESDARVAAISTEVTNRGAAIAAAMNAEVAARNTAIVNYGYTKEASDQSLAQQGTAITAAYKTYADAKTGQALTDAKAFVQGYSYSIADANSAIAASASTLNANIATAVSTAKGYTETWGYAKSAVDLAETAQFNALTANYKGYADGVGAAATSTAAADVRGYTLSTAGINGAITARSDALTVAFQSADTTALNAAKGYADTKKAEAITASDAAMRSYTMASADITGAIASATTSLTTSFQGADATNLTAARTYADSAIRSYTMSSSDITGAIATSTNSVTARLNGIGGPGVTIEQVFTAQASTIGGLSGQWAIKLNAAGQVAGIGLASSSATGTPSSIFTVVADKFALAYPGVNSKIPFVIGKVAGQSVIGLDGSVVIDGSLTIRAADGTVILSAGGLNAAYAAPGTLNSALEPSINAAQQTANAQSTITLVARGSVAMVGRTATKAIGTAANWDSDVYSKEGFTGGMFASANIPTRGLVAFGFNDDPLTAGDLASINFCIAGTADGSVVQRAPGIDLIIGTYVGGDQLSLTYDGSNMRWCKNGEVLATLAIAVTYTMYFDSSFYTPGVALSSINFGPLSSNAWNVIGGTGKPQDNATVGAPAGTLVGGTEAAALALSASQALAKANAATTAIDAMVSDNILSRSEKSKATADYNEIVGNHSGVFDRAAALGVSVTNLSANYTALVNYLNGLSPAWNDTGTDTVIDGGQYRATFFNYYYEREVARNATIAAAATRATAAGITGQMSVPQVASFIPANGITDVMIGGNLKSTNWNGQTGVGGAGWLLERSSGSLYGFNAVLRGAIMSPNMPAVGTWLAAGAGNVMYFGPECIQVGNFNDGNYFYAAANGTVLMPGFALVNKQITLTNTILIAPKIGDTMTGSVSPNSNIIYRNSNEQFNDVYAGNFTASAGNASANLSYAWSVSTESGYLSASLSSVSGVSAAVIITGKIFSGQEIDVFVSCRITDLNNGVSRVGNAILTVIAQ